MKLTIAVDISMYPLKSDYAQAVLDFIDSLKRDPQVSVQTNPMSTQIVGPADRIFPILQTSITQSFKDHGKSAFTLKILNSDLKEVIIPEPFGHETEPM